MQPSQLAWLASVLLSVQGADAPARAADKDAGVRPFEVEKVADVAYYDGDGADKVKHKLDLYLPKGQKDYPVLFFVHGGAWVHGDKNFLGVYENLGRFYAGRGVGVVVTNYRLSPAVKHPGHVQDVARAYAWTCQNIAKHGGNADAIFLCGHSAGGHLVSLLTADPSYAKAAGASLANVKGVVPISGVYSVPERFMPNVFGDMQTNASPLTHARAGLPPFLILYADKDMPGCDRDPSERFCKALKAKGVEAATQEVTKSDHYRIILSAMTPDAPVSDAILGFVRAKTAKK